MSIKLKTVIIFFFLFIPVLLGEIYYFAPIIEARQITIAKDSQVQLARQISASFDLMLGKAKSELEQLAGEIEKSSGTSERLNQMLAQASATSQFFFTYYILDEDGVWVSFPRKPGFVGKTLPSNSLKWVKKAFKRGETIALNVNRSKVDTLTSGFARSLSIKASGRKLLLRGVMVLTGDNSVLSLIKNASVGKNGYVYVVGSNGKLIANPSVQMKAGEPATYDFSGYSPVVNLMNGQEGLMKCRHDGETWIAAYYGIEPTGWGVVVQQPERDILSFAAKEVNLLVLNSLAVFLLCTLVLSFVISYSLRPISSVVGKIRARKFSPDEIYSDDEVGVIAGEFNTLYSELAKSEKNLRKVNDSLDILVTERTNDLIVALEQKDILLQEVHHRVKNNMLVISSLLKMQSQYLDDDGAKKVLIDSRTRIQCMSLIHEQLYRGNDMALIDFSEYAASLIRSLFRTYLVDIGKVKWNLRIKKNMVMKIDTAIPCGLIISESVTNCLKYAFPDNSEGEVDIAVELIRQGEYSLVIRDNGIGIPDDLDLDNLNSLGINLIKMLAEQQLRGEFKIFNDGGTVIEVRLKEATSKYKDD